MSETDTTSETGTLIQQGNTALEAGNSYEARKHFRRATELEPGNVEAWVGLAESARSYQDKHDYLAQALALDPNNPAIRTRKEEVETRLAAGEVLAATRKPAPPAPTSQADDVPPAVEAEAAAAPEVIYCYRHPERPANLRCTQCGNPICPDCTRPALVGQLCPDCARERRQPNYQVSVGNLVVTGLITLVASYAISYLVAWLFHGFFILLALFIAPIVGQFLVRILDYATRAKRGRSMQVMVAGSYLLGVFPLLVPILLGAHAVAALPLILFTVVILVTLMNQLK